MCGIAGEVFSVQAKDLHRIYETMNIERMISALDHRGPDDRSFWWDTFTCKSRQISVRLGMCRLAIIDREHGQQPFGDGCKVFFNGEIYNHKDLRTKHGTGYDLNCKTRCDSEVVAKLYELYCPIEFVRKLDGMFAIAIWDEDDMILRLYRDRIGKKPLYYYHDEAKGVFLFASEIKAILTHPCYEKKINERGIYQYLCLQYIPEPYTAFEGIMQVRPGCWLYYNPEKNEIATASYYDLMSDSARLYADLNIVVQNTVREAVHKRLESEVPLGVYLSGGIDSAVVTAMAAEKTKELHTFTMGFLEDEYNEAPAAQMIADRYKTIHHVETVTSVDLTNMAREIVKQYDQPFGDFSAIPTILLARLSKKYITVALNGDGGDEAFGGYVRYWKCQDEMDIFWRYMSVFPPSARAVIWPDFESDMCDPKAYIDSYLPNCFDDATRMMYCDMKTYLVNDIIVKMERATMASSVEARCPFLDPAVLELGLRIPASEKLTKTSGKTVLKEAFREYLPEQFLNLPKRGFSVPMNEWLRQSEGLILMGETILSKDGFSGIGINRKAVERGAAAHMAGAENHGHRLWLLIMLSMWLKEHFHA